MQAKWQFQPPHDFDSQNVLYSLQSRLLQAWTKVNVEDYYQNIILQYFDSLPLPEAQRKIAQQIKDINQGRSSYFKLVHQQEQRKKSLSKLEYLINNTNDQPEAINSESLKLICEQLKTLRDSNLGFTETLMRLYKETSHQEDVVSDQCMQMLKGLDEDNQFLKQSFLKNFILFQQGYDPFFLHHYDMKGHKKALQSSPTIDQLFTLSLSYACRLFKAKNQVVDILANKTIQKQQLHDGEYPKKLNQMRIRKFSKDRQNEKEKQEVRSNSLYFRRKKHSMTPNKNQQRQGQYRTINIKSTNAQRNMSTIGHETPQNKNLPFIQHYRRKEGNRSLPRNSFYRFKTEVETEQEPVSPQKQSIRININSPEPTVTQEEAMRKTNYKPQKNLRPLVNYKKFDKLRETPQETINPQQKKPLGPQPEKIQISFRKNSGLDSLNRSFNSNNLSPEGHNFSEASSPLLGKRKLVARQQMIGDSSDGRSVNSFNSMNSDIKFSDQGLNSNDSLLKQPIKMRQKKLSCQQLLQFIRNADLKPEIKASVNPKWEESLKKFQSYCIQFNSGDQLIILSICILLPDGNYLIKLWGPTQKCSQQISLSLFKKYLEFLEKNTKLNAILYNGNETKEILSNGFILKKQKSYVRSRKIKKSQKNNQSTQFLSLKCSNIIVPQENTYINMLISEQIEAFSSQNSFSLPSLVSIDRSSLSQNLQILVKVSQNISNVQTLNQLLDDQELDTYETSEKMNITDIKALRIKLETCFKIPFVIADKSLKFQGSLVQKNESSVICMLACNDFNTRMFFGKGFASINDFLKKSKVNKLKACEFSVRMFSKQLYGRLESSLSEGYYGNWEINFSYEDEFPGRTLHSSQNCIEFDSQSFFVAIEIESQLCYSFCVNDQDFLF